MSIILIFELYPAPGGYIFQIFPSVSRLSTEKCKKTPLFPIEKCKTALFKNSEKLKRNLRKPIDIYIYL